MGRLTKDFYLLLKFAKFHLAAQWSSQTNFWSGVIGMLVNNYLTLLGIWAMLFAGKSILDPLRDTLLITNFILMFAWGLVHIFLGGIANLDHQITEGALDYTLATPRSPFFILSLTQSHLPAWGDLILGLLGLIMFSLKLGFVFFIQSLFISIFATLALYAIFLLMGCLAFWFRRTEAVHSVLLNICLAYNTYPIVDTGTGMRWLFFLLPILFVGVVPAAFIISPAWPILLYEVAGSLILFLLTKKVFFVGLKKYQSSSTMSFK
jgi:ABC-2 type transport system permease protein